MTLLDCYNNIRDYADENGISIEPFEIISEVKRVRDYWKPEKINAILLAESHVYTSENDFLSNINFHQIGFPNYPIHFVRFVYCLGYGENQLLDYPINQNTGTPQFWKILYSCANPIINLGDFAPILI